MDKHHPHHDRLSLIAAQIRLLADLTLTARNLEEVQGDALALVLQDLAVRLERVAEQSEHCGQCPMRRHREGLR